MVEELNISFKKMRRSDSRSKGLIRMYFNPLKKITTKELKDKNTMETEFTCSCCGQKVKVLYCAGVSKIFCPYCGMDI